MSLAWLNQDDFAAGILRSVGLGMEVGLGVSNSINGLFDDDGDVYLRGNTTVYAGDGTLGPVTFIWTGALEAGSEGFISTATNLYRIDKTDHSLHQFISGDPLPRPVKPAVVGTKLFLPNGTAWTGSTAQLLTGALPAPLPGMVGSVHLAACGTRLVIGQGRYVRFSHAGAPTVFDPTDYHELPEGAQIRGLATIKDTLLVFTGYGIWAIMNMALDLTDDDGNPQQVVQKLMAEAGLLHEAGLTEWGGRIVAPLNDRVILLDTISTPTVISDSIAPLYAQHVKAGRLPGGAKVFHDHLFLPWLNPDNTVASTMVCRLNRPVRGRMTYYPWTILDGHAAQMTMGDISPIAETHTMLAAHTDGRIIDYGNLFTPDADVALDADGSTPDFDLETRDFPTGNGQPNHLRALRLYYTLIGPTDEDTFVEAALSYGGVSQTYEQLRNVGSYTDVADAFVTYQAVLHGGSDSSWEPNEWAADTDLLWSPLDGQAHETRAADPKQWVLAQPKRVRYMRARFRCSDPVVKLIVHRVGFGIRPATHQR